MQVESLEEHEALPGACYLVQLDSTSSWGFIWYWLVEMLPLDLTDHEPVRTIALSLSAISLWVLHTLSIFAVVVRSSASSFLVRSVLVSA